MIISTLRFRSTKKDASYTNLTHQDEHFKISQLNANAQVTHDRTKRPLKRYKFFSDKTHPNTLKSRQSIKKNDPDNLWLLLFASKNMLNSNIPYFSTFCSNSLSFLIYYWICTFLSTTHRCLLTQELGKAKICVRCKTDVVTNLALDPISSNDNF